MICQIRDHNECACTTVCAVAKPITPAPVILPSWRTQMAVTAAFGLILAWLGYAALF